MCGMRARRVGHCQTLETAVRGIGAHFRGSGRQELSSRSDENPIYDDKPYAFSSGGQKTMGGTPKGSRGRDKSVTVMTSRRVTRLGESLSRPIAGDLSSSPRLSND